MFVSHNVSRRQFSYLLYIYGHVSRLVNDPHSEFVPSQTIRIVFVVVSKRLLAVLALIVVHSIYMATSVALSYTLSNAYA